MGDGWTAIIVNYNGAVFLESCISALQQSTVPPGEIIVVDNNSTDDSLLELNGFPRVVVVPLPVNRGFAGGANAGLEITETTVALILNPDVEVEPEFGDKLVQAFEINSRLGAAGALLVYPDLETIQHAGGIVEHPLMETRHRGYGEPVSDQYLLDRSIDFVTGAAMGLRVEAVSQVGSFDELFTPVYYEDVDLCARLIEANWQVRYLPQLRATHVEGVTLSQSIDYYKYLHQNRLRFALKHLPEATWNREFVPAEFERLRHRLFEEHKRNWPELTGAGAIDALLRKQPWAAGWPTESLLKSELLQDRSDAIAWLSELSDIQEVRQYSRIPVLGWLQRTMHRSMDPVIERQQSFNRAILESLKSSDQLHREQLAALLLFGLLALRPPAAVTHQQQSDRELEC